MLVFCLQIFEGLSEVMSQLKVAFHVQVADGGTNQHASRSIGFARSSAPCNFMDILGTDVTSDALRVYLFLCSRFSVGYDTGHFDLNSVY